MATTHSPAGEGRTCFLRSIWGKWVWLLSSSAFGMGRVWEVAAMAAAHAGSPCCHAGPRSTRQRHTAALGSGSWRTTESGCAHPCQCLADPLPLTPRGRCLLLPSRTWLQFGAGWGSRWVSAFPSLTPCCDQTSLAFPEAPQPLQGVTQPNHFQANSSFFSTFISAEAVGQREEELRAGRGGRVQVTGAGLTG